MVEDSIGEGGGLSVIRCSRSFDNLTACGVNDTAFYRNSVGRKGGAVVIAGGDAYSKVEFHNCTVENSTTGMQTKDDPQGEGGAFTVGGRCSLLLADCIIANNYCGKKVRRVGG